MAGRAVGLDLQQYCIAVAVHPGFLEIKVIAGELSLVPKVFPAAAVEPNLRAFHSPLQRAGVHVTQHQHLAGIDVLGNGRHQALVIELYFHCVPYLETGYACSSAKIRGSSSRLFI